MTARIQRSFDFMACVHFQSEFYTNFYEFDALLNVETDSIEEQNIALERIKYFLEYSLQHSMFVNEADTKTIEKFIDTDMKICTLPEDPYDQIVGIMLLQKLNAIAEGRLVVTDITINSRLSDGVICFHSIEESMGPFNQIGWWNVSNLKINDIKLKGKKVIKMIKKSFEWSELDLGWATEPKQKTETNQVVFVNFDKLEK